MVVELEPLPAWLGLDERKAERWPIDWPSALAGSLRTTTPRVRIVDLSTHGCRLADVDALTIGRFVSLTLPRSVQVEGWTAWTHHAQAGVSFANPLHDDLVRQIAGATMRRAA